MAVTDVAELLGDDHGLPAGLLAALGPAVGLLQSSGVVPPAGLSTADAEALMIKVAGIEANVALLVQQLAGVVSFIDGLTKAAEANPLARKFLKAGG